MKRKMNEMKLSLIGADASVPVPVECRLREKPPMSSSVVRLPYLPLETVVVETETVFCSSSIQQAVRVSPFVDEYDVDEASGVFF